MLVLMKGYRLGKSLLVQLNNPAIKRQKPKHIQNPMSEYRCFVCDIHLGIKEAIIVDVVLGCVIIRRCKMNITDEHN